MHQLIKIAIGPFALVFAVWFNVVLVPQLPIELQTQINDGFLGMIIGLFGAACVLVCCTVSWRELDSWMSGRKHAQDRPGH